MRNDYLVGEYVSYKFNLIYCCSLTFSNNDIFGFQFGMRPNEIKSENGIMIIDRAQDNNSQWVISK